MLNIYCPISAEIRCKGDEENAVGPSELCENSERKHNYPCLRTLKRMIQEISKQRTPLFTLPPPDFFASSSDLRKNFCNL